MNEMIRHIRPMIARQPGQYRDLEKAMETMNQAALRDLFRLLRNYEDDVAQAKRLQVFPFRR